MNKLILSLLFLACFTLPFSFRISTIFLLLFSGVCLIQGVMEKTFSVHKLSQLLYLPSLFLLIALIGTVFSPYKEDGVKLIIKHLPYLFVSLAYIYATEPIRKEAPKVISKGIVIGVTGILLYLFCITIYRFIGANESEILSIFSQKYTYNRFIDPIDSHPTYMAILVIMSNYFIYNTIKIKPVLKLLLLLFNFLGLIFIMSRIGIIIFLIQIIVLFFFLNSKQKWIYATTCLIVVFSSIYIYNTHLRNFYLFQRLSLELAWDINPKNSASEINNRNADDSRIARWGTIVETIKEKPLFGYGTGSEDYTLAKTYKKNDLRISLERGYNTHNQYLFFLLENGLLGLIFFLLFFVKNIRDSIKRTDILGFLFLFTLFTVCFFENYLNRTMGVIAISIFLTFMKKTIK